MPVVADNEKEPERQRENEEYERAEVGGKLNLAQDVTAPGNTGASVR